MRKIHVRRSAFMLCLAVTMPLLAGGLTDAAPVACVGTGGVAVGACPAGQLLAVQVGAGPGAAPVLTTVSLTVTSWIPPSVDGVVHVDPLGLGVAWVDAEGAGVGGAAPKGHACVGAAGTQAGVSDDTSSC